MALPDHQRVSPIAISVDIAKLFRSSVCSDPDPLQIKEQSASYARQRRHAHSYEKRDLPSIEVGKNLMDWY
jgi:hypothetical protein